MDSQEKLDAVISGASTVPIEDEGVARMQQAIQSFGPMLRGQLPDTAEELDEFLLSAATWALSMRSDGAEPVSEEQGRQLTAALLGGVVVE